MSALEYFANTSVVQIATLTQDGREILTPIWAVVVGDAVYVRNGSGDQSKWFRRARRNGAVAFADGSTRYAVRLENAPSAVLDAVDDAYRQKYVGSGLREVVTEPIRSRTLRVLINQ